MNKPNYQLIMEEMIRQAKSEYTDHVPTLLLHSCCGPCSTYCLEVLSAHFEVTVFYYNPNIYPREEYFMRVKEQQRFISEFPAVHPIHFIEGDYDTDRFYEMSRGLENVREGGERCFKCYRLRLEQTAAEAKKGGFDYFTTTLSISPLKNAGKLNEIGGILAEEYQVPYLFSDFKKKNGYKRSTELSREYHMYRQYYCGCEFSKAQRDKEIAENQQKPCSDK